ncbi:exo-alpha-sialidase [Plantactinospora sp. CA-294935]|uniref:exo-alpha-sialidase n=1 Tax=Plantactinospora sp. CA-294935 TaxID=3240012 RepID=UPI003D8BCB47
MPRPSRRTFLRTTTLAGIGAAAGLTTSTVGASRADARSPVEYVTVFESLMGGYHTFRIPAVIQAPDGTVLAFAEGRRTAAADSGDIDLVLRRSHDGGRTWGPLQVVGDNGPNTFGNPVPLVDPTSGDIVLLTTHNAGHVTAAQIRSGTIPPEDSRRPHVQRSSDSGATWSDPVDITADVKRPQWRWYATGPCHGIVLRHGPHAGRMIVPCNYSTVDEAGSSYGTAHLIFSDDGGHTWQLGAVDAGRTATGSPNENVAVELADGTIYLNGRNNHFLNPGNRVETTSTDGGLSFDHPFVPIPEIVSPQVQGSALALSPAAGNRSRIVFSGPGHHSARENLTLYSSFDQASTWGDGVLLYEGPAGYSDLVELDTAENGVPMIGVLYESGERLEEIVGSGLAYHQRTTFARVRVTMLDTPTPPPRVTPDVSGRGNHAWVSGTPALVTGVRGGALQMSGDYVELPLNDDLAFGESPFTVAAWFRTGHRDHNQALFWAYAQSSTRAKWRIQLEPGVPRVSALVDDTESARVLAGARNVFDNRWHHVAFVRSLIDCKLYVDGELVATTAPVLGSVSAGALTGVRIGARVDGINLPFVGDIDEVWLIRAPMPAFAIRILMENNTTGSEHVVAHLPFNRTEAARSRTTR